MYIVGEYLFLENLIINYLILQSTKTITRSKVNKKRIIITAMIAALYPFIIFFPSLMFLSKFIMKLIISILIVKVAFNAKTLGLYLKQLSAFYIISFVFAGASIGFYYFTNNYYNNLTNNFNISHGFPIKYLIFGVVIGEVLIKNILQYYYGKKSREKELMQVLINFKDKTSTLTALIDTGNSLIEPITKLPVFVVEYSVIESLLPEKIRELYKNKSLDFLSLERLMVEMKEDMKISLIPFKAIGSKNGMLLGFRPDYICISDDSGVKVYEDLLIGIFNDRLSIDEQYKGLLNLDILKGGELNVKES